MADTDNSSPDSEHRAAVRAAMREFGYESPDEELWDVLLPPAMPELGYESPDEGLRDVLLPPPDADGDSDDDAAERVGRRPLDFAARITAAPFRRRVRRRLPSDSESEETRDVRRILGVVPDADRGSDDDAAAPIKN